MRLYKDMKDLEKNYDMEKKSGEKEEFKMPEIDIVAGATSSSKKFKKMMKFLVEKAESGEVGDYRMKL